MTDSWRLEDSPLGAVLIPPDIPPRRAIFYTTAAFGGALDHAIAGRIENFLRDRFGVAASLATCEQVHGVRAERITMRPDRWSECSSCDALYTSESAVALGIKVADCLPVTLVDREHFVVANVHSGWRGAAARILPRVIDRLRTETKFSAESAVAFLGPAIRQCCFEVGEEVIDAFRSSHDEMERFTRRDRGPRPFLDLAALTTSLLLDSGFRRERIHDSGLCTRCQGESFHSYRRNGPSSGRNLAIVAQ